MILDVGCGSGLSGEILSSIDPSEGGPHIWVGKDISCSRILDRASRFEPEVSTQRFRLVRYSGCVMRRVARFLLRGGYRGSLMDCTRV